MEKQLCWVRDAAFPQRGLSWGSPTLPRARLVGLTLKSGRGGKKPKFVGRSAWPTAPAARHPTPLPSLKPARGEEDVSKGSLQVPELRLAFLYITLVCYIVEGEGMLAYSSKCPAVHATFVESGGSQVWLIIKTTWEAGAGCWLYKNTIAGLPHTHACWTRTTWLVRGRGGIQTFISLTLELCI